MTTSVRCLATPHARTFEATRRGRVVAGATVALGLLVSACATRQPETSAAKTSPEALSDTQQLPDNELPKGHVWRHEVMRVMSPGLGAFLQRVQVKAVRDGDEFRGFRIVSLHGDPSFWSRADLRPGDVVTRINDMPIGHYDEAMRVWDSLPLAPSIDIAYQRGSEQRHYRLVIHDDETAPPPAVVQPAR